MKRILILGLATSFICLTLSVQATPVITKEIDDRYSKELGRDLYLDLKFYYDTYGMGDERLREIVEIDFALEGSAKTKSIKYSSYERSMSYHYIFARDPTAREIIIITPISETSNITTINLWWLKNSAPFGVLPGSITFYPDRTEIATFEEKVKLNEVKVYAQA